MTFAPRFPSLTQVTVDKHFYKQRYCVLPYERASSIPRMFAVVRMYICTLARLKHRLTVSHPCSSFISILYILLLLLLFLVLSGFSFLFFFLHPAPYGSSSLSFREELAYNIHKKVFRVSRCLVFSRGSLKFLQCHRETLDSRSMCRDSGQIPPLLIFCQGFRICGTEFCLSFQMFLLTEARTPVFPFKNHSNVFSIIRE